MLVRKALSSCIAIGVIALGLVTNGPAAAQTCTTAGSSLTCTNDGTIAGAISILNSANPGITTVTNSGSDGQFFSVSTLNDGSMTATNSGSIGQYFFATTNGNGTTTATNSGSIGQYFFASTSNNGTTTATNGGSVGQYFRVTTGNGATTATNNGSVGQYFSVSTLNNGSTTATNNGNVAQYFQAATNGNGTTTARNTGSVGQYLLVSTNGNGTTTATNTGSVGQYFQVNVTGSGTATAINSGRVFGGVRALGSSSVIGANLSVVNSGLVDSTGLAISFFGAGVISDTLTLLPGSRIIGGINLIGTNDAVVMNAGNQNLTFNTLASATVTGDVPFVVVGNRIASIDPTPLAMQGRALNDFTRDATSAIPQLSGMAPAGGAPLAFAAPDASARIEEVFASIPGLAAYSNEGMVFKNPTVIYGDGSAVWARGFAGSRVQQADGPLLHAANQFYGGMLGGDLRLRPDLRLGAFIGMGNSRSAIDLNFGNSSSDLAFGGVYAQYDAGALFLRAALQGGGSHNFTTRNINDNTVAGGLANANASFNG